MYVCAMHALPFEFIERINRQFPQEAADFLDALHTPAQASVRINSFKPGASFVDAQRVPWNDEGFVLATRPRYTLDPKLHAGCYYPQESSSMALQWVLKHCGLDEGTFDALDVCAAPGGKSLILADFLAGRGRLVSNEIIRSRAHVLQEVLVKWGAPNVVVTNNHPADFGRGAMLFDLMLVDAPCSGEGMFRKDPEARNEWTPQSSTVCSTRQREILHDALPALKEGGVLIYSTCTFAAEENEDVVRHLVESGDFESIRWPVPAEWNIDVIDENAVYAMRFLPHRVKGEGFFIAALRKKAAASVPKQKPKSVFADLTANEKRALADNGILSQGLLLGPDKELYRSVFSIHELNVLASNLYLLQPGVHMGRVIRSDFKPAHACALAQDEVFPLEPVELNEQLALAYLRGESISFDAPNGWQRVAFGGAVLGWVKVIGHRINNYYPKDWRVKIKE